MDCCTHYAILFQEVITSSLHSKSMQHSEDPFNSTDWQKIIFKFFRAPECTFASLNEHKAKYFPSGATRKMEANFT